MKNHDPTRVPRLELPGRWCPARQTRATTTTTTTTTRLSMAHPRARLSRAAAVRAASEGALVARETVDDDDEPRGGREAEETFVRELPGASGGLEEATLAVMRGVSLGDVCARTGVETMVRTRGDGTVVMDEEAVARTTEAALDAALAEKVAVLGRYEGKIGGKRTTTEGDGSVQSAFQRAVFARKLHERVVATVRREVRARAESDLRTARRDAQERRMLEHRDSVKLKMEAQREAPHKPWFLLETSKQEQARLRKMAMVEAAAAETGALTTAALDAWTTPKHLQTEEIPDPNDDSIVGAVKTCFYMVQSHPRPIQKILDYLFGYSPSVDGEDLEEIVAYGKGLPVPRTKRPKEIAYVYAANLDKILGERDKMALKMLIKDVKDEWSSHIKAGFDAVKQLESTPLDSAEDIRTQNRDSWLRAMFPTYDWPTRTEKNYKFMETWRDNHSSASRGFSSKPIPLAVARANLAKQSALMGENDVKSVDMGHRQIHYSKDGVPIVAPVGFFPKTETVQSKRTEAARMRMAAEEADRKLRERRQL